MQSGYPYLLTMTSHQTIGHLSKFLNGCNDVVMNAWLGLPHGYVMCPGSGKRQPYIDIATET